jgi:hypothetical protein
MKRGEREVIFVGRIFAVLLDGKFEGCGVVIDNGDEAGTVLYSEHVSGSDKIRVRQQSQPRPTRETLCKGLTAKQSLHAMMRGPRAA